MPEETKRFQCRHIFTDGRRCGSPCLRKPGGHEDFCYYHHTARRPAREVGRSRRRITTFTLPLMEDRSAIQHSIGQVLQKLAQNELDPRRAGLLLYGLQIASLNLPPQKRLEPAKEETTVEEITTDTKQGTLAPDAELIPAEAKEKNSAREILDEWNNRDLQDARVLPSVQAVVDNAVTQSTCPVAALTSANHRFALVCRNFAALRLGGTHPARLIEWTRVTSLRANTPPPLSASSPVKASSPSSPHLPAARSS